MIISTFLILLFGTFTSFATAACKNKDIKQMISFGDSILDTGNVYNYRTNRTYPPSPPYYNGRYCNGPVYIERLFDTLKKHCNFNDLNKLQDYAYGAATTDNNLVTGHTINRIEVPGVLQQVNQYISDSKTCAAPQSQRLYFVEGGANNLANNSTITNVETVNSLMQSVKQLLSSGAKHVFVMNYSPFQYSPSSVALGPQVQAFVANYYIGANQLLLNAIKNLAGVTLVDLYTIGLNMVNNPATYGFTDNSTACVTITNPTPVCSHPNQHIFWDFNHYTTHVHKILAETIFDQIKDRI